MRKVYLHFLVILFLASTGYGQKDKPPGPPWKIGISAGLDLPIGKFSDTHVLGFGVSATLFKHQFEIPDTAISNRLGFLVSAGFDLYLGKAETTGTYSFGYDEYTYLHLVPGVVYQTGRRTHLRLDLGPAFSLDGGNAELGFLTNLGGYYFFSDHVAVSPQVGLLKLARADPLLHCSLRGTVIF